MHTPNPRSKFANGLNTRWWYANLLILFHGINKIILIYIEDDLNQFSYTVLPVIETLVMRQQGFRSHTAAGNKMLAFGNSVL